MLNLEALAAELESMDMDVDLSTNNMLVFDPRPSHWQDAVHVRRDGRYDSDTESHPALPIIRRHLTEAGR